MVVIGQYLPVFVCITHENKKKIPIKRGCHATPPAPLQIRHWNKYKFKTPGKTPVYWILTNVRLLYLEKYCTLAVVCPLHQATHQNKLLSLHLDKYKLPNCLDIYLKCSKISVQSLKYLPITHGRVVVHLDKYGSLYHIV